jgi:murein DD-endopeptidase MepM/ murein hydrolase activator NlpD
MRLRPFLPVVFLFFLNPFAEPEPGPTPEEPLTLQAEVQPSRVAQGDVATVLVKANRPIVGADGSIAGRSVVVDWNGDTAWAYAGFNNTAALGYREATIHVWVLGGEEASITVGMDVVPMTYDVDYLIIPPGQTGLLDPGLMNREWNELIAITSGVTYQRYWRNPFILPAEGWISSHYGSRRSYNGGPPVDPHQGTDIAAKAGAPIHAANSGYASIWNWYVRGNTIMIDHGLGLWSGYYHLAGVTVTDGQYVNQGDLIGYLGATGLATGPHLHWDVILQGIHTQPLAWTKLTAPY